MDNIENKPKAYLIKNEQFEKSLIEASCNLLKECDLEKDANIDNVNVEFAYTIEIEDRGGEALLKLIKDNKEYVIALQKGSLKLIGIKEQNFGIVTDEQFNEAINSVMNYWNPIDTEKYYALAHERKNRNNEYIMSQGIVCNTNLGLVEPSCYVKLKSLDEICIRAIVSFITIQIACDINHNMYEESMKVFKPILDKYDGYKYLNEKEKRIIDGTYTTQDAIDLDWAYEALQSLLYALSFVDDIKDASQLCDCDYIISLFKDWPTIEEFKQRAKLRDIEEILDTLDLYYRYNWAINEKRINPSANIGNLNPSNVIERRRGLEWLISDEDDWYDISLNA